MASSGLAAAALSVVLHLLVPGSCQRCDSRSWGCVQPPPNVCPSAFSYKKKDADLSVAQGRIKDLEVLFHRSEAELNTVLNEKRSLEAEVADLRAQLAKVGQGLPPGFSTGCAVRPAALCTCFVVRHH